MLKEVVGLAEVEEGHRLEKRLMEAEEGEGLPEVEEAEKSSGSWINLNQKILPTSLHLLRTMIIHHLLKRDVMELLVQIWEGEVVEDGEDVVEDEEGVVGVVEDGEDLVANRQVMFVFLVFLRRKMTN